METVEQKIEETFKQMPKEQTNDLEVKVVNFKLKFYLCRNFLSYEKNKIIFHHFFIIFYYFL